MVIFSVGFGAGNVFFKNIPQIMVSKLLRKRHIIQLI